MGEAVSTRRCKRPLTLCPTATRSASSSKLCRAFTSSPSTLPSLRISSLSAASIQRLPFSHGITLPPGSILLRALGKGTFWCGTVIVEGHDFIAEGITFENSAPKGSGQAVAIRVSADRCAFSNCRFLGWQDTVYLYAGKHYISHSYIEGSVDFIFGNAKAMLEHCHIHCKSQGFITAQARKSEEEPTGYVFIRCVITGNGEGSYAYMGRPWEPFARVVFAYTWMDGCIKPEGWDNWNHPEREATARFYEYRCSGPGSATSGRCKWARQLTDEEAEQYLSDRFIDPDPHKSWLANKISLKAPLSA